MALKLFPFPKYREEGDKEMAEQASVEQGVESFLCVYVEERYSWVVGRSTFRFLRLLYTYLVYQFQK